MSPAPTAPVAIETITPKLIDEATAECSRLDRHARRLLRDKRAPTTAEDAAVVLQQIGLMSGLWGVALECVSLADEIDAFAERALSVQETAQTRIRDLTGWLDDDGHDVDLAALELHEQGATELAAFQTALEKFVDSMIGFESVRRLLLAYVGDVLACVLAFDREQKRRQLLAVVADARARISMIVASTSEPDALRARWERRLGRTFALTDLPAPRIQE